MEKISESLARAAKEANSFSDYAEGMQPLNTMHSARTRGGSQKRESRAFRPNATPNWIGLWSGTANAWRNGRTRTTRTKRVARPY